MKHESYREEKFPCAKCKHVFEFYEHDSPVRFYCTKKGGKRPLCGSNSMDESFFDRTLEKESMYKLFDDREKEWDEWSEGRQVKELGTCDKWEAGRVFI